MQPFLNVAVLSTLQSVTGEVHSQGREITPQSELFQQTLLAALQGSGMTISNALAETKEIQPQNPLMLMIPGTFRAPLQPENLESVTLTSSPTESDHDEEPATSTEAAQAQALLLAASPLLMSLGQVMAAMQVVQAPPAPEAAPAAQLAQPQMAPVNEVGAFAPLELLSTPATDVQPLHAESQGGSGNPEKLQSTSNVQTASATQVTPTLQVAPATQTTPILQVASAIQATPAEQNAPVALLTSAKSPAPLTEPETAAIRAEAPLGSANSHQGTPQQKAPSSAGARPESPVSQDQMSLQAKEAPPLRGESQEAALNTRDGSSLGDAQPERRVTFQKLLQVKALQAAEPSAEHAPTIAKPVERRVTPALVGVGPGAFREQALQHLESQREAVTAQRPLPDAEQLLHQVTRSIKLMLDDHQSEIRLHLHPEHLGTIIVKLVVAEGAVRANLVAHDSAVGAAMEANLDSLKHRLEEQGLRVEQVHVAVGSDHSFNHPQERHPSEQQQHSNGRPAHTLQDSLPESAGSQGPLQEPVIHIRRTHGTGMRINSLA